VCWRGMGGLPIRSLGSPSRALILVLHTGQNGLLVQLLNPCTQPMDCIFDGDVGLIASGKWNFDGLVDTDPSYYITIQSLDKTEHIGVRFSSIPLSHGGLHSSSSKC
jgi:hypothetical protein